MTSTEGSDVNSNMIYGSDNKSTISDYDISDTAGNVLVEPDYILYLENHPENPNNYDEVEVEKDEGEDPHFRMFMKNIRPVGKSFVAKGKGGSEKKYEGSVVSDDVEDKEGRRKCDAENLRSVHGRNRRNSSERRFKSDHKRVRKSRNVVKKGKVQGRVKKVKRRNNVDREESFAETEIDCLMGRGDLRSEHLSNVSRKRKRRRNEDISHISEPQFKHDKEDVLQDPTYTDFLDACVVEGDAFVIYADGKRVEYENDNDNQSSSDLEVLVFDKPLDCMELNYTPASNSKVLDARMQEDDCQCLGGCSKTENPLFRKEVMDILIKPFSKKEYKRLWHDVKLRKPIKRHIDLRQGNKSISQAEIGRSYLDHYVDVERQLVAFENDIPRRLNVLRGFFFYLKKMSEDGIFKPWLDKSCLAIIPRTG